eukprot:g80897.t1
MCAYVEHPWRTQLWSRQTPWRCVLCVPKFTQPFRRADFSSHRRFTFHAPLMRPLCFSRFDCSSIILQPKHSSNVSSPDALPQV